MSNVKISVSPTTGANNTTDQQQQQTVPQVKARKEAALAKKAELGEKFKPKYELKTPKGTRDFGPEQMAVREKVLAIITEAFKRHGAVTIDTPVFELRDVLMGKYGEEGSKLVYELDDQGGELLALRYDLTVPFARYLAANKIRAIKRYQIAKVYRRDNPVMTKGRYREFYQCDFDIAGQGDLMVQEAECLKIIDEVLSKLDLGDFEIRLNHRQLLEGIFAASGIPPTQFKTVASSVDKMDKQPWNEIRTELVKDKRVDEQAVDLLGEFVQIRDEHPEWDNQELFNWFSAAEWTNKCNCAPQVVQTIRTAIDELKLLVQYADLFGCGPSRVLFEPSLARGLDYYTGVIYEVVMKEFSFNPNALSVKGASNVVKAAKKGKEGVAGTDSKNDENGKNAIASETTTVAPTAEDGKESEEEETTGNLGSVAAGGRYDRLVGMFAGMGGGAAKKEGRRGGASGSEVPCVGVSFGIERLFAIMEMKMRAETEHSVRTSPSQVFIASIKMGAAGERVKHVLLHERMKICAMLWEAGIRTETSYKANPKLLEQIQYCEHPSNQIDWMLIVGEDELAADAVKLRNVPERKEELVKLVDLVPVLLDKLATSKNTDE